jgi:hypothetical protein
LGARYERPSRDQVTPVGSRFRVLIRARWTPNPLGDGSFVHRADFVTLLELGKTYRLGIVVYGWLADGARG